MVSQPWDNVPPRCSLSPVAASSGHADRAPTGLKIFRFRPTFPWLARHGLDDHATPWLNTIRGPAPLIKARVTGFRVPRTVILTPMRVRGSQTVVPITPNSQCSRAARTAPPGPASAWPFAVWSQCRAQRRSECNTRASPTTGSVPCRGKPGSYPSRRP